MPHRFTQTEEGRLAGIWSTCNRRTYCAWEFEPTTRTLKSRRGMRVQAATLESETRTLDELREELPRLALALVQADGASP